MAVAIKTNRIVALMRSLSYKHGVTLWNIPIGFSFILQGNKKSRYAKILDVVAMSSIISLINVRNPIERQGSQDILDFKSKHDSRQSYKSKCVGTNIKEFDKAIQLPKLGKVCCRISKQVCRRILSATVSRPPSGKYFVSLCCTDIGIDHLPLTGAIVG